MVHASHALYFKTFTICTYEVPSTSRYATPLRAPRSSRSTHAAGRLDGALEAGHRHRRVRERRAPCVPVDRFWGATSKTATVAANVGVGWPSTLLVDTGSLILHTPQKPSTSTVRVAVKISLRRSSCSGFLFSASLAFPSHQTTSRDGSQA
ncbi:hypothetical protein C8J57DRAFT_1270921 [Mycena rebaudengoi]|nr:hypothetical protein C8J57DRAFT_1387482 [Mycena rebaudengoi]KAJ7290953.1 hypothetical protein C8J57DRAFT_1270921 [Mycena rebaudengoi]